MKLPTPLLPLALAVCFIPQQLPAQNLQEFSKRVTEFTLANGMHFIVLERHEAPVVSFHTYVNAGSVDDPKGETGLAHMFEHMAFKGTETIGSTNWPAEKTGPRQNREQSTTSSTPNATRAPTPTQPKSSTLKAELQAAIDKADSYVVPNLYPRIIEENGGVGMNASTGEDSTDYFYSFPANRVELWFYLESARFLHPVFREFYKERNVVREERRMRVESDPQGKLMEANAGHRHRRASLPRHARRLGQRHREPARGGRREVLQRITTCPPISPSAIVGDVNPAHIEALWRKSTSAASRNALCPDPIITVEPQQDGPKRTEVASPAQPMEFIAYHRPDQYDKDDPVFDVVSGLLSGGRTSIMYKDMVRDKKLALAAGAESEFPGGKYPSLFFFYLIPGLGHTAAENEKELDVLIANLKKEKVDEAALARVKTRTRAGLIRQLDNNAGLAQLAGQLLRQLRRLEKAVHFARRYRQSDGGRRAARGAQVLHAGKPHRSRKPIQRRRRRPMNRAYTAASSRVAHLCSCFSRRRRPDRRPRLTRT